MNIRVFKEIVSKLDDYEEKFNLFRTWADNCFINYKNQMKLKYTEIQYEYGGAENFINSLEYLEMNYQWKHLSYNSAVNLYNRMGWEIDEKLEHSRLMHDDEVDCFYYDIEFEDIYINIKELEDDIEFAYAVMTIIEDLGNNRDIYFNYSSNVYEGIKECNLEDCLILLKEDGIQKVFIAMSFSDSMKEARNNIEKAVKDCGYTPILIDVKEHNNQIVPEIYKEIEGSKFVVADLTGQRGGVYYEAGYAVAKDKTLILCCKKSEDENPHFDVAQINTIFWTDEENLYERLRKRIEVSIGINR